MNDSSAFILVMVVIVGLGFDFTNGFHDAANAMATSIATGALKPRVAVGISAAANLLGAFLSLSVAATIAKGIVNQDSVTIEVVFAGLAGGVAWNVMTWYLQRWNRALPVGRIEGIAGAAGRTRLGRRGGEWCAQCRVTG